MSQSRALRASFHNRIAQLSALTLLLAGIGVVAFHLKYSVLDYDIWWHLKVGDWIIEHFSLPHTGILSRTAGDRPWVAYSWGYEVLLSRAYTWFGLLGIGLFGTLLTLGVAYSIFWMLRRLSGRFWLACVLSGIVCSAFLFNGMPRPVFFSMVLLCVALTLILESARTGQIRLLYWLPPLFLLWTNLHIQFIYGLFVAGLFVGVTIAEHLAASFGILPPFFSQSSLPVRPLVAILVLCFLATLVGPNFYHPYFVVYAYSKAKFTYSIISELQPMSFRGYSHFATLLLTAAGFFVLGREKKLDTFKLALLTAASLIAYRTMRDAWFICIPAAACIADYSPARGEREAPGTLRENATVFGALAVLLLLFAQLMDFNERGLDRKISADYPVNAINFLRRNPVPGPLYNNLDWGGFLMWYMPDYPVAIDGRNDLYGDDLDRLFFSSENAASSYTSDPYLNDAGVVLLESDLPLAKVLTADPRFKLIYQDPIATVFARR